MNRWTRRCLALMLLILAMPASADDALQGTWTLAAIGEAEPKEEQAVTYAFDADTVSITVAVAGRAQTWSFGYTVSAEGELTLEPGEGPGDPSPTVFNYRIENDTLVLELEAFGAEMTFTRTAAGQ